MTNKPSTPTIEAGCYIDSHYGIYAIELLYDLALDLVDTDLLPEGIEDMGAVIRHALHGDTDSRISAFGHFEFDENGTRIGKGMTWQDANEYVSEFYDELTDLLPADDRHAWMWSDGELFYWSISDIEQFFV